MIDNNDSQSRESIAQRPSNDGNPADTILAGAPDGAPYAEDKSAGKDLGDAAPTAGYSDGGAPSTTPDVQGFATPGNPGTSDLGASTSGDGAGNGSTNLSGADPTRTIDQEPLGNTGNPGAEVLSDEEDDAS